METSYLHQQRLAEAIKKLHMLGHRNYGSHGFEEAGHAALGAITSPLIAQQTKQTEQQKAAQKALQEQKQFNEDKEFIKGNRSDSPVKNPYFYDPMNPTAEADDKNYIKYAQTGYPMRPYDPNEGLAEIDKHNAAEGATVAGYDTQAGLQNRMKSSADIGMDMESGRQLMRQGGMMNSLSGLKPGNF